MSQRSPAKTAAPSGSGKTTAAQALRSHNAQLADAALTKLGEAGQPLSELSAAVSASKETAV